MPVRHVRSVSEDQSGGIQTRNNMETIWLQRSSPDIPWGFRLVGGREFGVPLSVQRVTPGSVAAAGLASGDLILKVGNVMATNLEHNDAMELVKQAGNILQLTIKKVDNPAQGSLSPGSGYGSQTQINDNSGYSTTPRGFSTGITISSPYSNNYTSSNATPNYATTPRNYGSQQKPQTTYQAQPYGTRIEIQRVPPQQKSGYSNSYDDVDTGGSSFPDYTLAYREQEPIHDSPGGPVNISGYKPNQNTSYTSNTLPRGGGYNSSDRDGFGGSSGPPAYEPRSYNQNQSSFSPRQAESKFSTGLPLQQASPQKPPSQPQVYNSAPQSYSSAPQSYQPSYNSPQAQQSQPFSPQSYSGQMSPRSQSSVSSGYPGYREPTTPSSTLYNQTPSSGYGSSSGYDQSNVHGSGSNTYSTLPHSKPAYSNNNNSYNVYNNAPKPFTPAAQASPTPFSPTSQQQPKPWQPAMSPSASSTQHPIRRVSFDQSTNDNTSYTPSSNFSPRPYKSPPPASTSNYTSPGYNRSTSQQEDYGVSDFGTTAPQPVAYSAPQPVSYTPQPAAYTPQPAAYTPQPAAYTPQPAAYTPQPAAYTPQPASYSRQSSRSNDPYSPSPYGPPGGPMSPRSDSSFGYGGNRGGYDPSGVSAGMDNMNLGSPRAYEPPAPAAPAPPPPPPPPSGPPPPPPPPAPPLGEWNTTPYRRQPSQPSEGGEQEIPDKLLNTMMKSAKGGGPKPFSYGIDLSELKKKMGPPTAPKPRGGQAQHPNGNDDDPAPYRGPRKPAGYIQKDYLPSQNDKSRQEENRAPKKPAGQIQSDYFLNKDDSPRAEIDESSLRVQMGTNPKKQSKSFKVLQWMTETEKDDEGGKQDASKEPTYKPKRSKDPERRHNADDDEMTFSGLHSKADIPSKAFGVLQKISEDGSGPTQNGRDTLDVGDAEDGVGNYDETSIRYKGKNIPSPSFRVLQTWAEHDPDPNLKTSGSKRDEEEDDGLPDTLNSDEAVDKRYKGGHIPSKVFKVLQMSVGDDTPEEPSANPQAPAAQQAPNVAPSSDF